MLNLIKKTTSNNCKFLFFILLFIFNIILIIILNKIKINNSYSYKASFFFTAIKFLNVSS